MFWEDGSIYRGFWDNSVQDGLGIMIFKDGMRKAGFFKENIYESPLAIIDELEEFLLKKNFKCPESFR